MEKVLQRIKESYKMINIAILCICLYLLFVFPIFSNILEKISPTLTRCPYLQITGKPCPLCGGTRFLQNFKNVFYDFHYVLNFFGLITLIIILEVFFRIINIRKNEKRESVIKWDIIIHSILFLSYLIYAMYYINK